MRVTCRRAADHRRRVRVHRAPRGGEGTDDDRGPPRALAARGQARAGPLERRVRLDSARLGAGPGSRARRTRPLIRARRAPPLPRRPLRGGDPLPVWVDVLCQQDGAASGQPLRDDRGRPRAARGARPLGRLGRGARHAVRRSSDPERRRRKRRSRSMRAGLAALGVLCGLAACSGGSDTAPVAKTAPAASTAADCTATAAGRSGNSGPGSRVRFRDARPGHGDHRGGGRQDGLPRTGKTVHPHGNRLRGRLHDSRPGRRDQRLADRRTGRLRAARREWRSPVLLPPGIGRDRRRRRLHHRDDQAGPLSGRRSSAPAHIHMEVHYQEVAASSPRCSSRAIPTCPTASSRARSSSSARSRPRRNASPDASTSSFQRNSDPLADVCT